jgi:hypothetical protein
VHQTSLLDAKIERPAITTCKVLSETIAVQSLTQLQCSRTDTYKQFWWVSDKAFPCCARLCFNIAHQVGDVALLSTMPFFLMMAIVHIESAFVLALHGGPAKLHNLTNTQGLMSLESLRNT